MLCREKRAGSIRRLGCRYRGRGYNTGPNTPHHIGGVRLSETKGAHDSINLRAKEMILVLNEGLDKLLARLVKLAIRFLIAPALHKTKARATDFPG